MQKHTAPSVQTIGEAQEPHTGTVHTYIAHQILEAIKIYPWNTVGQCPMSRCPLLFGKGKISIQASEFCDLLIHIAYSAQYLTFFILADHWATGRDNNIFPTCYTTNAAFSAKHRGMGYVCVSQGWRCSEITRGVKVENYGHGRLTLYVLGLMCIGISKGQEIPMLITPCGL